MPLETVYCMPDGLFGITRSMARVGFEETPGETRKPKGKRQNRPTRCTSGASDTHQQYTGQEAGPNLAYMVFRLGVGPENFYLIFLFYRAKQ